MTSYTCPYCGMVSHNPKDAEHRYCGACHRYSSPTKFPDVDHHLPPTLCPWCAHQLDAAFGIGSDNAPAIGDCTVCIKCGGVGLWGIGMVLTRCPDAVWQAWPEPLPTQLRDAKLAIILANSGGAA